MALTLTKSWKSNTQIFILKPLMDVWKLLEPFTDRVYKPKKGLFKLIPEGS